MTKHTKISVDDVWYSKADGHVVSILQVIENSTVVLRPPNGFEYDYEWAQFLDEYSPTPVDTEATDIK